MPPEYVLVPESETVPPPASVRAKAPLTLPVTDRDVPAAVVHVWAPPRATLALMTFGPEPLATLIPVPRLLPLTAKALMVSVNGPPVPEAMVVPAVLLVPVPEKLRLLIVKFWSSVVLRLLALVAVNVTLEFESGSARVFVVPAKEVTKFVAVPAPPGCDAQLPSMPPCQYDWALPASAVTVRISCVVVELARLNWYDVAPNEMVGVPIVRLLPNPPEAVMKT